MLMRFLLPGCGLALVLLQSATASVTAQAVQEWTWYTGDTHVHFSGCSNTSMSTSKIVERMLASGTHVANVLVWGGCTPVSGVVECSDALDGPLHVGQLHDLPIPDPTQDLILHVDYELSSLPGDKQSHQVLLNLAQTGIADGSGVSYPGQDFLLPNFTWAQSQGALVGTSHGQTWKVDQYDVAPAAQLAPRELPLDAILARLDFLEANRIGSADYRWILYRLWDANLPVAPVAGSDFPCREDGYGVGRVQVVVPLPADEPLSFEAYIEAIGAGRTVIRDNVEGIEPDLINLRVNGHGLGSTLNVAAGMTTLEIEIDGVSGIARQPIELLVNGEVVFRERLEATPTTFVHTLEIDRSSWIAVRTPSAHTMATFVLIEGWPVRNDPQGALRWVDYLGDWYAQQSGLGALGISDPQAGLAVQRAQELWTLVHDQGQPDAAMINVRPAVHAGEDQLHFGPTTTVLEGFVADDGLPHPAMLRSLWIKRRGPGVVEWGDPTMPVTTAHFSQPGRYVLQLRVFDGAFEMQDELVVLVRPDMTPRPAAPLQH